MARPKVENICTMPALAFARTAKRTINRYTTAPNTNSAAATSGADNSGSSAKNANRKKVAYIAIIKNSPCAKFTTSISPKISASPTAMSP